MAVKTVTLGRSRFVIMPAEEYQRLRKQAGSRRGDRWVKKSKVKRPMAQTMEQLNAHVTRNYDALCRVAEENAVRLIGRKHL